MSLCAPDIPIHFRRAPSGHVAVGFASAVVLVSIAGALWQSHPLSTSSLLGVAQGKKQQRLEELDGGLWASLDNSVPLKSASSEVDIGGHVLPTHQAHRAMPVAGQIDGGQFLSDSVRRDPNHLGIYGGMYWGQQTAPAKKSRGRRSTDKWLRAPARGQRGASGRDSDAEVGGIIHALEHQRSPAPPEWWVRKRREWLRKQRLQEAKKALTKHLIKINPDFTGTPLDHEREERYKRGPALQGLQPVSLHAKSRKSKAHRAAAPAARHSKRALTGSSGSGILVLPGKHLLHPHSQGAIDLHNELRATASTRPVEPKSSPRETTVQEALDRAEAIRKRTDSHLSQHDRDQAAALERTAASLRKLSRAMSAREFAATPNKLATIAKQLSLVSESLAGSAEKEASP